MSSSSYCSWTGPLSELPSHSKKCEKKSPPRPPDRKKVRQEYADNINVRRAPHFFFFTQVCAFANNDGCFVEQKVPFDADVSRILLSDLDESVLIDEGTSTLRPH